MAIAVNNAKLPRLVSHGLTAALLVAHLAMTVMDFFGAVPAADFLRRSDGSRMDPHRMLPLEELFVAMVAFPFVIIVLAFTLLTRHDAARLSAAVHGLYTFHQVWKKAVWDAAIHPDSDFITTRFLIAIHVLWAVVSLVIGWLEQQQSLPPLLPPSVSATSQKVKAG